MTCLFIIFLFFLLVQWLSKWGIKGLFPPQILLLSLTLFKSHYCSNESVHVVTAGFVWVFAEPAYTWFLPGDMNLAWENEFFLGRQTCLVHSFAVTICAVVEKKKLRVQDCWKWRVKITEAFWWLCRVKMWAVLPQLLTLCSMACFTRIKGCVQVCRIELFCALNSRSLWKHFHPSSYSVAKALFAQKLCPSQSVPFICL